VERTIVISRFQFNFILIYFIPVIEKKDTGEESLNLKPDDLTKKGDNSLPESISTSEVHVEESQSSSTTPNTNEKLSSIQCPTCSGTCEIPYQGHDLSPHLMGLFYGSR
jgi:hypothetical protein